MSYIKQDESGGGGDTYTLRAAQSGSDVDLQLDATTGADSDVKLKAGTNITLTEASDTITIDASGISGITVQDEGTPLSTLATTLNFAGSGVVATGSGATKTITVAGGGGGASGYLQAVTNWPNFGTNVLVFIPASNPPLGYSVLTLGANTLSDDIQFAPWLFREDTTIKDIGFRVSSSANPVEMCVYESNSDGFPTNKVANSTATFSSPSSGVNMATMAAGASGITFSANELYWCAITNTTTGANVNLTTHGDGGSVVGFPGFIFNRQTLQLVTGTVNALPASIGTLSISAGFQAFMAFARKA